MKDQIFMQTADNAKNSIFDNILQTESQHLIDAEIHKHANRVGITLKMLYARDMVLLRERFISDLTILVKNTLEQVDNELSKTEED